MAKQTKPKSRGEWLFFQFTPDPEGDEDRLGTMVIFDAEFRKVVGNPEDSFGEMIFNRIKSAPVLLAPIKES